MYACVPQVRNTRLLCAQLYDYLLNTAKQKIYEEVSIIFGSALPSLIHAPRKKRGGRGGEREKDGICKR